MRGDGTRTTESKEKRKKVPHGTTEHGKRGRKFHMEQTKGTKKPPRGGGGFDVMKYNRMGDFGKSTW